MADVAGRSRLFGWRGVVLIVVGVSLGALTIAPGVGLAAKFLTKQQVKKRYLGNTTIVAQSNSGPNSAGTATTVNCPPGKQATGGGAAAPGTVNPAATYSGIVTIESKPLGVGRSTGWYVETLQLTNSGATSVSFTAYAVCSA